MAWTKLDDRFWRHPKIRRLLDMGRRGLEAIGLWAVAQSWIAEELTDGWIPSRQPLRLLGEDPTEAVDALLVVGLWERAGDDFQVHDYLNYNPSRAKVLDDRAKRSAAGKVGAEVRWDTDGKSHGSSDSGSDSKSHGKVPSILDGSMDAPVPSTRVPGTQIPKVPARERETWPDDVSDIFRDAWHQRGFRLPPTTDQIGAIRMKPLTWDVAADLVTNAPHRARASQVVSHVLDGLTAGLAAERAEEARGSARKVRGRPGGQPTKAGDILASLDVAFRSGQ